MALENDIQNHTSTIKNPNHTSYVIRHKSYLSHPFGMVMPGRNYTSASGYRYGFNGMEKDDEVKGANNSYTTEFRQYDPRVGRWLSIDPKESAWESPYVGLGNNPILFVDYKGDSVDVSNLSPQKTYDCKSEQDILIHDLKELSGVQSLYVNQFGKIDYNGDGVVSGGSKSARRKLLKAIGHKRKNIDVFNINLGDDLGDTDYESGTVSIDFNKISQQEFRGGLNKLTQGVGMVFMHELHHTKLFGFRSLSGLTEESIALNKENIIRRQMGTMYGQRYRPALTLDNHIYDIFNRDAYKSTMNLTQAPSKGMYIVTPK